MRPEPVDRSATPDLSRWETKDLYDRLARWYDLLGGVWENRVRQESLQALDLQAGETCLEIGPGTGLALPALANNAGKTGEEHEPL